MGVLHLNLRRSAVTEITTALMSAIAIFSSSATLFDELKGVKGFFQFGINVLHVPLCEPSHDLIVITFAQTSAGTPNRPTRR
jgi:hypothetical protein